ncbi:MAG: tryptophan--tRNA ligase [Clostridia bacterium]|nr:tryptophan--tRNA ligase [Clostridia bacterium]
MEEQKIIFSGIQPSGTITLGNYIGAVRNWPLVAEKGLGIFSVVDMHAITVRNTPADLRARTLSTLAIILASGVDPEKNIVFIQSHVPAHAELAWILNCYTMYGELSRMTQFKDKSKQHADNINAGLFTYPVLMAADILLYGTDLVPVGVDQKQHLELARDIAIRFNGIYGDVFKVPEGYIPPLGAKVMSLAQPEKKMSKSDPNPKSYISIIDEKDVIIRKFKSAVTDSDNKIAFSDDKPGISNLLTIYSVMTGKTIEEAVQEFDGKGYGDFKLAVGEAVADGLSPLKEKYDYLMSNKDYLEKVYTESAEKAFYLSRKTLSKVYKKIGFIKR